MLPKTVRSIPSLFRVARRVAMQPLACALVCTGLWATAPTSALADDVVLKDGTTRQGRVVEQDDNYVVLESRLGRIRIRRSEVAEIRADDAQPTDADTVGTDPTPAPAAADETPTVKPAPLPTVVRAAPAPKPAAAPPQSPDEDVDVVDAADRLRRMQRSRIVRRTTDNAAAAAPEPTTSSQASIAASATVGGRFLAEVPKGTPLIVFQPPRPFAAAPGSIEIGRRIFARMQLAGSASAFVARPGAAGDTRVPLRLADVKRHLEVTSDASRIRIMEGVNGGDWLRLRLTDDSVVQGRLAGIEDDAVRLLGLDDLGESKPITVAATSIVEVDGLIRDTASQLALLDLEDGEPLAITFWPGGESVLGRYVKGPSGAVSLDTDGDGVVDRNVPRNGPLAEVRRIPAQHRRLAVALARGSVVRAAFRETFPEGLIRRTVIGPVEAVTAFALSVDVGDGSMVVPFDGVTSLDVIEDDPQEEVDNYRATLDREPFVTDLPLLPGCPAADGKLLDEDAGISAINDGRVVTHVFVSVPHADEVFGIRLGEPVAHSLRRSALRFDTVVVRRAEPGEPKPPQEYISETINGLRVVILTDGVGAVTALEIGLRGSD